MLGRFLLGGRAQFTDPHIDMAVCVFILGVLAWGYCCVRPRAGQNKIIQCLASNTSATQIALLGCALSALQRVALCNVVLPATPTS